MGETKAEHFCRYEKFSSTRSRRLGGVKLPFHRQRSCAGLGDTVFGGLAHISSMIMSVGGVKGVEFGKAILSPRGSEANDSIVIKTGAATLNNSRAVWTTASKIYDWSSPTPRPSPYINREQRTIETGKMREV